MMRIRSWQDMDMAVKLYVSTAGDFVQLGTRQEFPFKSGGLIGVPQDWQPYATNGLYEEAVFSTSNGRFYIRPAGQMIVNRYYGAFRQFPVQQGKRYVFYVRTQTTTGYENPKWYMEVRRQPQDTIIWNNYHPTEQSQTQLAGFTQFLSAGETHIEIRLLAYWGSDLEGTGNWGMNYADFAILETDQSYPPPTWEEITCDTRTVRARHGRDRFTARYDVGSFSIGVLNDDGAFTYDPNSTLRPGRFIRGTIIPPGDSLERPMFYGVIESLVDAYSLDGHAITVINAIDMSSLLSNTQVPWTSGLENYSGNRINNFYIVAGWHPSYRRSDSGQYIQQRAYANSRSIREEIGLGADSEGGYWFADRSGVLQYYDRTWPTRTTKQTQVQANILAMPEPSVLPTIDGFPDAAGAPQVCARALNTDWSRARIVNEVQLANAGGTARTFTDNASKKRYGQFTYQRLDFINSNQYPEYLDERAADIMAGFAEPVLRVNSVEIRPTTQDGYWASQVFLNDVVRVWYVHPENLWAYAVVTHVQSVEHAFTPTDWTLTLALDQPIIFTRFRWPTPSKHGWDQGLWNVNLWDEE